MNPADLHYSLILRNNLLSMPWPLPPLRWQREVVPRYVEVVVYRPDDIAALPLTSLLALQTPLVQRAGYAGGRHVVALHLPHHVVDCVLLLPVGD